MAREISFVSACRNKCEMMDICLLDKEKRIASRMTIINTSIGEMRCKMATVITVAVQKGGSGKSTTAGVMAHLLSKDAKVLVVDMDSQGNCSELVTGVPDLEVFRGETILEALKEGDVRPYIKQVHSNLHVVPADDFLATFTRWLYIDFMQEVKDGQREAGNIVLILKNALQPVLDYYDYIIIDTPPALGEQTLNALAASDYVVIMFETSKFCFSAIKNFLGTVENVQERVNPGLKVAGILRSIIDNRRKDAKEFLDLVVEEYGSYCPVFNTVINRTAAVGRLSLTGFSNNPEIRQVEQEYEPFVKELLQSVGKS